MTKITALSDEALSSIRGGTSGQMLPRGSWNNTNQPLMAADDGFRFLPNLPFAPGPVILPPNTSGDVLG